MKIVIFVFGSRGDVQPGVALGVGLQKQGHQVSLVTHTYFEKFIRQYDLGFWGIPGDVNQLLNNAPLLSCGKISRTKTWLKPFSKPSSLKFGRMPATWVKNCAGKMAFRKQSKLLRKRIELRKGYQFQAQRRADGHDRACDIAQKKESTF